MRAKNRCGLTTQRQINLASRSFFLSVRYAILSSLFYTSMAFSHEVRPAYLELHQTSNDTYDVMWKVPGQGEDLRLGLYVQLPESCSNLSATARCFRRQRVYRALEHQLRNGFERRHDPYCRTFGNLDRCFGATGATRRHHSSDAPYARHAFIRRRGRSQPNGNRPHVSCSWS